MIDPVVTDQSVDKGRAFVSNYVQYVHFVEEISNMTEKAAGHHHPAPKATGHKH